MNFKCLFVSECICLLSSFPIKTTKPLSLYTPNWFLFLSPCFLLSLWKVCVFLLQQWTTMGWGFWFRALWGRRSRTSKRSLVTIVRMKFMQCSRSVLWIPMRLLKSSSFKVTSFPSVYLLLGDIVLDLEQFFFGVFSSPGFFFGLRACRWNWGFRVWSGDPAEQSLIFLWSFSISIFIF